MLIVVGAFASDGQIEEGPYTLPVQDQATQLDWMFHSIDGGCVARLLSHHIHAAVLHSCMHPKCIASYVSCTYTVGRSSNRV